MQQEKVLYQRFINILGVKRRPPSLPALTELIKAHLSVIPFENISKLFYKATLNQDNLPSFDQYLTGIGEFRFGGTCYSNNYYFFKLLGYLGYRVQLRSADMKNPGVHMVIVAALEGKEYLVDVGYAAPFIQAIPLFLKEDHFINSGRDRYVVKPRDPEGCTTVQMYRDEKYKHGYLINPESRKLEDFQQVIRNSFQPDATFFNSILITKNVSGRYCTLHNQEYTEATGSEISLQQILQINALATQVEDIFKIPAYISSKVLDGMEFSGDAWS
jgi:arylamine N-acetyltransferase